MEKKWISLPLPVQPHWTLSVSCYVKLLNTVASNVTIYSSLSSLTPFHNGHFYIKHCQNVPIHMENLNNEIIPLHFVVEQSIHEQDSTA
jgi:hypothetical protein